MGLNPFAQMGSNLIRDKIVAEVEKLIENNLKSEVISKLIPQAPWNEDAANIFSYRANAVAEIRKVVISYREHIGKTETPRTIEISPRTKTLEISGKTRLTRPSDVQENSAPSIENLTLSLSGKLSGMEFKQMFFGVGATIDGIELDCSVKCGGTSFWGEEKKA